MGEGLKSEYTIQGGVTVIVINRTKFNNFSMLNKYS